MRKLHVVPWKEALDPERVRGKVVIVIDTLFATTTIATALAHGADAVIPVRDAAEGRREAQRWPEGSYLLAGEHHLEMIPGFASPLPLMLIGEGLAGRRLIYSTTNGTVALRLAEAAASVCTGALVNATAVLAYVRAVAGSAPVLVLCAGARGALSLEDFYTAGMFVDALTEGAGERWRLSDTARAARRLYCSWDPESCLRESRIGRIVCAMGLAEEVEFAARVDALDVVPVLVGGVLRGVWGSA